MSPSRPFAKRSARTATTRDAQITARGKLVADGGRVVPDLLNVRLEATGAPPDLPADVVEVTGVARAAAKGADRLEIRGVTGRDGRR
jgi:hypothetical protein